MITILDDFNTYDYNTYEYNTYDYYTYDADYYYSYSCSYDRMIHDTFLLNRNV